MGGRTAKDAAGATAPGAAHAGWRLWQFSVLVLGSSWLFGGAADSPSVDLTTAVVEPAASAPRTPREAPRRLVVQTLNVFGLPWPAGIDVATRARRIAARIAGERPDVVALQEAWDDDSRPWLRCDGYHLVRADSPRGIADECGLVTLSRLPIVHAATLRFATAAGFDAMVRKGALHTRIALGGGEELDVFNVHLQSHACPEVRLAQIEQLAAWVRQVAASGRVLVLGDFNCGPGDAEFEHLLGSLPPPVCHACAGATYDAGTNPLAGPEPPLAIDHIVLAGVATCIERSVLAFRHGPGEAPFSDHYGVETVFSWPRAALARAR